MDDAVEVVSGYVDDLWKLGDLVYTEQRMKSFLDVIGDEVVSLVKNSIEEVKRSRFFFMTLLSNFARISTCFFF